MDKESYLKRLDEQKKLQELMKKDKYLLNFHLFAPSGWINDPNGLCQFKGVNHIYYQYTPFSAKWGPKLWGHYTTKDWINYKEEEPFLFSDTFDDRDGVYSGTAFIKDERIYFFYTGNVKQIGDFDYIKSGREQNTILVTSEDGYTYSKKITVLRNEDYHSMSCHVRDPQIFAKNGRYYMILGARDLDDIGCVTIYESFDLFKWKHHMEIRTDKKFGYMWECPNLIEIEGRMFLICCPQGVEKNGINFANIYQCGYFSIDIDFEKKEYKLGEFVELDRGFDIYAPQIYTDEKKRKIIIGWLGLPDAEYTNPTIENGWQHALTLPKEIKIKDGKIYQLPLDEMKKLRTIESKDFSEKSVLQNYENVEINIEFEKCKNLSLFLRDEIEIVFKNNILTLNLEKCGFGRKRREVYLKKLEKLQIFLDNSSIEIFVNSGAELFSSRCYCKDLRSKFKILGEFDLNNFIWYGLDKIKIDKILEEKK